MSRMRGALQDGVNKSQDDIYKFVKRWLYFLLFDWTEPTNITIIWRRDAEDARGSIELKFVSRA